MPRQKTTKEAHERLDNHDIILQAYDTRLTKLERAMWALGGGATVLGVIAFLHQIGILTITIGG